MNDLDDDGELTEHSTEAETELEKEFKAAYDEVNDKINAFITEAESALDNAVQLSELYGVPFYSSISFLRNTYYPQSHYEKFAGIDSEYVISITEAYNEYPGEGGWRHSAVC